MSPISREKTDAEWQAEEDARSLARAEEIKADESRLSKAQDAAKVMADEEAEKAKAMRKVAGRKKSEPDSNKEDNSKEKPKRVFSGPEEVASPSVGGKFNVFKRID